MVYYWGFIFNDVLKIVEHIYITSIKTFTYALEEYYSEKKQEC